MAVPVIASSSSLTDVANATSRNLTCASGITSGDGLIVVSALDGITTGSYTISDSFTIVRVLASATGMLAISAKISDGTEGSDVTIGSAAETGVHTMMRITGSSATTVEELIQCLSITNGEGANAPNLPCYASSADTLILRLATCDGGIAITQPGGQTSVVNVTGSASGASSSICYATQATAGYAGLLTHTLASSEQFVAATLVITSTLTETTPLYPVIRCIEGRAPALIQALSYDLPWNTVDDDLLLMDSSADANVLSNPSWTSLYDDTNTGTFKQINYKIAASETGPYTGSSTTSSSKFGYLLRITNVDTSAAINTSSTAKATSAAPAAGTITPTVDNCLIYASMSADDDDITPGSGFVSGFTGIISIETLLGADAAFISCFLNQTSKTATGSMAFTMAASEEWIAHGVAIAPLNSPNGTANVPGASSTGQAGTIAPTGGASTSVTGVSATGQAGTVTAAAAVDATANVTGVSATGSAGTLTATGGATASITGVSATGQAGTITANGSAVANITGASATGQAGTVSANVSVSADITGVSSTGQAGTLSANGTAVANITGVSASGQAGTIAPTGSANANITGVEATGAVGDLTATADSNATADVPGVSATGNAGTLTANGAATANVTGASATGGVGTLTATGSALANITGAQATGQVGTLTANASANASIDGVSAEGQAGDVSAAAEGDATANIEGVEATGNVGTISASDDQLAGDNAPAYSSGKGWAKYAFARAQPHGVEPEKPKQFTPTKANDNKPKRKQRSESEVIRSLADLGTAYQDKFTAQKESAEAQAEQQRLQAATLRKQALLAQQQADDDMLIMLVLAAA